MNTNIASVTFLVLMVWIGGCAQAPEPGHRDAVAKAFAEDHAAWAEVSYDFMSLLKSHRFDELDDQITALQRSYEQGANEWAVLNAFLIFSTKDENYSPDFDAWVAANAAHWPARLARGIHHVALGWKKRGTKFMKETSTDQVEQMRHHFAQAKIDVTAALEQVPRAVVGYSMLLQIARGTGQDREKQRVIDAALEVAPSTYYIRWQHIFGIQPKWGGSQQQIHKFAHAAQEWREQNPRVYALLGFEHAVLGERAQRNKDYERAVAAFSEALQYGPVGGWLHDRAWCLSRLERHAEAIQDLNVVLAKSPEDSKAFSQRGYSYMRSGQLSAATADFERALQLNPGLSHASNNLAWLYSRQGDPARAAEQFDQTLLHDPNNVYALTQCGINRAHLKQLDRAEVCLARALELAPQDATVWRNYGDVLHMRGDPKHLEALALYLKYAESDREGEMYKKVAAYLAEQNYSLPAPVARTPGPRGVPRK